jgi:hypothetical protein
MISAETGERLMAYVTRHHWFSSAGAMFLGFTALTLGSMGLYREPWFMVPGVLLFGFGAVATGIMLVKREVALRVDETGIGSDSEMMPWADVLWLEVDKKYVWIASGELRELTPQDFDDEEDFRPGVEPVKVHLHGIPMAGTRFRRDLFDAAVLAYSPRVAGTAPHTYPQTSADLPDAAPAAAENE